MSTTIRPSTIIRPGTTIRPTTTIRRRGGRSRLAALAAAAAMTLAACGSGTDVDTGGAVGPDDAAELPTNDDTGADEGAVMSGMCIEDEPDCEDMVVEDGGTPLGDDAGGGATSSCLVGDEDCTDESYGGADVTRSVPVISERSGAEQATRGEADGATGATIDAVYAVDETTLEVSWSGGACDVVQDVLVQESPAEVRLLVLTGIEVGVEACTQQLAQWSIDVELEGPLADRAVLDLSD